jgi:hypothetical protein
VSKGRSKEDKILAAWKKLRTEKAALLDTWDFDRPGRPPVRADAVRLEFAHPKEVGLILPDVVEPKLIR